MSSQRILHLISACILISGVVAAVLIYYRAASADTTRETGYQIVGGFIYQAGGTRTKSYTHDLQLYGGNAAVLSDDFMHWFFGLWQGTSLAYTVAVIAVFISFALFVIGNNLPMDRTGCEKTGFTENS